MPFSSKLNQYLDSFAKTVPNGVNSNTYLLVVNSLTNSPLLLQQLEDAISGWWAPRLKGIRAEGCCPGLCIPLIEPLKEFV